MWAAESRPFFAGPPSLQLRATRVRDGEGSSSYFTLETLSTTRALGAPLVRQRGTFAVVHAHPGTSAGGGRRRVHIGSVGGALAASVRPASGSAPTLGESQPQLSATHRGPVPGQPQRFTVCQDGGSSAALKWSDAGATPRWCPRRRARPVFWRGVSARARRVTPIDDRNAPTPYKYSNDGVRPRLVPQRPRRSASEWSNAVRTSACGSKDDAGWLGKRGSHRPPAVPLRC